jgi:hypothetical protein
VLDPLTLSAVLLLQPPVVLEGSRPQLDLGGEPKVVSTHQTGAGAASATVTETAPSGGALGGVKQSAAVVASGINSLTLVRTRVSASVRAVLATSVPIVQVGLKLRHTEHRCT